MIKTISIEGVKLTDQALKQIEIWQKDNSKDLEFEIDTLDSTITCLAESEAEADGGTAWPLVQRLLALKSSLKLFKTESHEQS